MTVQPLPMSPDWDVRSMPEALPEPLGIQGLHAVLRKAGARNVDQKQRLAARQQRWIQELQQLCSRIQHEWLSGLVASDEVTLAAIEVPLNEQLIGSYRAPGLLINLADRAVRLEPKGTMVIGAAGRVDLQGPGGFATLVLESPDFPLKPFHECVFTWSLVARTPRVVKIPLDANTFADALLQVGGFMNPVTASI